MRPALYSSLLMACLVSVFGQNSLDNAGLETSTENPGNSVILLGAGSSALPSWTVGGSGVTYVGSLVTASQGARSVHLHRGSPGWIEQKFGTVAGQAYRVTYDVSAYVSPNGSTARLMRGKATASSPTTPSLATQNFSYDGTGKTFPNVGWSTFTFDFIANGANATLRFETSETGAAGPMIDNVRVVPGRDVGGTWVSDGALVFVTKMPVNSQTKLGEMHTLGVEVIGGAPISYQWYKKNTFGEVYNAIANQTGPTLTLGPIVQSIAGVYRVIASNSVSTLTNNTSLAIVQPPIFSRQPEEQHVAAGGTLNFNNISFLGSAPDQFQWFKNNQPIPDATNSFYQKTPVTLDDAGQYYLHVENIAGQTNSVTVGVVVVEGAIPPWFPARSQPPVFTATEVGTSFSIFAFADGALPISYFWFKDGEPIPDATLNSFGKNNVIEADSGQYTVMASNSVGTAMSSVARVVVYPFQQFPAFADGSFRTNGAVGSPFTLTYAMSQGGHCDFKWYIRRLEDPVDKRTLIPGETNQSIVFPILKLSDAGFYTLVATNFKGLAEKTVELVVDSPPVFSSPPGGYEGPAGGTVNLTANLVNWSAQTTYKWYRNDTLIPNATSQSYSFTAGAQTVGTYTVVAANTAGQAASPPALVTLRDVTPAAGEWVLVADATTDIPARTGVKFTAIGEGHLQDAVVTFTGGLDFPDVGGAYRWTSPNGVAKVADQNDALPGFGAASTYFAGVSNDDAGKIGFVAGLTDSADHGIFERSNGAFIPVASQDTDMPGRPGLKFGRLGYVSHAAGKMAFLGMENRVNGPIYRGLFVWDGASLGAWATSDQPLPAGNGIWAGNSSQVGFDGSTIALWAFDGNTNNGIFKSVNAGPLQKIAFSGDTIPGGIGTFKSFYSPPRVQDGRVLFLASANEFSGNLLLEDSPGGMRIIARAGNAPAGAGPFSTINHGFDFAADGQILFSAAGPGAKQGVYNWNNGVISEVITTLNTLFGRMMLSVGLSDADRKDLLINVNFDGIRSGLYASVGNNNAEGPRLEITVSGDSIFLSWIGNATLEESSNLTQWNERAGGSPQSIPLGGAIAKFFRLVQR